MDLGHIENNNAFAQSNVRSFPLLCFLASVEASSGMREVKRLNAVVISVPYSFIWILLNVFQPPSFSVPVEHALFISFTGCFLFNSTAFSGSWRRSLHLVVMVEVEEVEVEGVRKKFVSKKNKNKKNFPSYFCDSSASQFLIQYCRTMSVAAGNSSGHDSASSCFSSCAWSTAISTSFSKSVTS